jgi:hypothetical protein
VLELVCRSSEDRLTSSISPAGTPPAHAPASSGGSGIAASSQSDQRSSTALASSPSEFATPTTLPSHAPMITKLATAIQDSLRIAAAYYARRPAEINES